MTGNCSGYAAGVPRYRRAMAIAVMFLLATGGVLARATYSRVPHAWPAREMGEFKEPFLRRAHRALTKESRMPPLPSESSGSAPRPRPLRGATSGPPRRTGRSARQTKTAST